MTPEPVARWHTVSVPVAVAGSSVRLSEEFCRRAQPFFGSIRLVADPEEPVAGAIVVLATNDLVQGHLEPERHVTSALERYRQLAAVLVAQGSPVRPRRRQPPPEAVASDDRYGPVEVPALSDQYRLRSLLFELSGRNAPIPLLNIDMRRPRKSPGGTQPRSDVAFERAMGIVSRRVIALFSTGDAVGDDSNTFWQIFNAAVSVQFGQTEPEFPRGFEGAMGGFMPFSDVVEHVVRRVGLAWHARLIPTWLATPNRHLDGVRPLDLLLTQPDRLGDLDDAIDLEIAGALA